MFKTFSRTPDAQHIFHEIPIFKIFSRKPGFRNIFTSRTVFEARTSKIAKSSETRFPKLSRRSEPSSVGKRPVDISEMFENVTPQKVVEARTIKIAKSCETRKRPVEISEIFKK